MTGTDVYTACGYPSISGFSYPYQYYDIEDLDPTYSSYPAYGMGGSIFSAAPMFGAPMGGNTQEYFNQMRQYQQFYNDYNIDQQKMQRNSDLRINASMEAIQCAYNALKDKIQKNEQGQIIDAYNNFVSAVGTAYGSGTEQEIKARAATLYSQLSGGKSVVQDLRENGHGPFMQGVFNSMTFGLYDSRSVEDNIATITNTPAATSDKVKQNVGRLVGAAGMGTLAGTVASKFLKSGKAGWVGLAVGAGAALLSFITGKVTTSPS